MKNTWTKPKGVRMEDGRWEWLERRAVRGGWGGAEWRQLYLNNNKKERQREKKNKDVWLRVQTLE